VDSHGSFMAGVLASPVYELLGKKGFGTPGDYLTDAMPPVGQLIGGDLAWRQHEGGHDVTPNWPSFFEWVGNYISAPAVPVAKAPAEQKPDGSAAALKESTGAPAKAIELAQNSTDAPKRGVAETPAPRTDVNSKLAHEQLVEKAKQGGIDVYFLGDSITRRWGCSDRAWAQLLENWKKNFYGWNAGDFGWGADSIQNVLWRIQNGELDGVHPKVIVILAGTNNIGSQPANNAKIEDITRGLKAIVNTCQEKAPEATIILTGIFPRNDNMAVMPAINKVNENLAKMADGKKIRFLNVNDKLADADGKLFDGMMNAGDKLHPTVQGYQVWADGLKPILTELLGPPAATDHAPPPTGDPSAAPKPAPAKD
jgi:lysophospholipase L1-like esterase